MDWMIGPFSLSLTTISLFTLPFVVFKLVSSVLSAFPSWTSQGPPQNLPAPIEQGPQIFQSFMLSLQSKLGEMA
jgi:hypothetical protein